jgi:hypothetical protein
MHESYLRGLPWRRFKEFISPSADRFALLRELVIEAALDYSELEIAGNRHLVLAPPPEEEYLRRPPIILVAHHDRAEGSPGANDNSAGVFLLFEAAMKLTKSGVKNWIIIFTGKEELSPGEGIRNQGAYTLAAGLKTVKMENSRIFCFDACGTGDTLIISSTIEHLLNREGEGEKFRESVLELRNFAMQAARELAMKKVLLAPTPFSDDLGFFRAGLAAQTITMLPSAECIKLMADLRKNPELADVLINAEFRRNVRTGQLIPDTWRCLNGPGDSYLRLTPQHYRTVVRFAETLCRNA